VVWITTFDRHYQVSRGARAAVGISCVVAVLALVLVIAEGADAPWVAIMALAAAFGVWSGYMAISKGGIDERPSGIANPQPMWWRRAEWSWADIDCFRSVGGRVYVVLRNGTASPLIGAGSARGVDGAPSRSLGRSRTRGLPTVCRPGGQVVRPRCATMA
jgi:hypothetical protein